MKKITIAALAICIAVVVAIAVFIFPPKTVTKHPREVF